MKNTREVFKTVKTVILSTAVFFIFNGVCFASVSSSENYKLYSGMANGGGASSTSTSYNSESAVGAPVGTEKVTSGKYKIFSGVLSTMNAIPTVSITSYNDGEPMTDDTPTLSWTYADKDGNSQLYYQVQVSKNNFETTEVDTGLISAGDTSYTTPILPAEEAEVSYKWRVRVSDGFDYSGWETANYGFRLLSEKMDVPLIWARVSPAGEEIASKLWQDCANPYMYWEFPVTGVDIAGYSYAWGSLPDDEVDTTGFSYQTPSELLSDGTRVFNLKAQNTAGNWSETASFEIWIDRGEPSLGLYSPSDGTIISTDIPNVSVSVTDELSGVNPNGINMKVNRSSVKASYDEEARQVVYIPSIPLSEGDNVISLEVSDIVGNKTSPLIWSFTVDTKGPAGSIIINNQDALTNSVYVNLDLSATDATTEVKSMIVSNDGVFDTEKWEPFNKRKEDWQLPAISGTRKVYVKFKDSAGNESQILSDTIELIIIAPDTIITSGPNLLTTSKKALFTFKSNVGNCVFRWKFDGGEWSEWTAESSASKDNLAEGNHYFKVQAAKDVNKNGAIDIDEIDPVPEERTWTIGGKGEIKPDKEKKKPFRFWKEE